MARESAAENATNVCNLQHALGFGPVKISIWKAAPIAEMAAETSLKPGGGISSNVVAGKRCACDGAGLLTALEPGFFRRIDCALMAERLSPASGF